MIGVILGIAGVGTLIIKRWDAPLPMNIGGLGGGGNHSDAVDKRGALAQPFFSFCHRRRTAFGFLDGSAAVSGL